MMDAFEKIVYRAGFGLVLGGVFLSIILTRDGAKAAGWPAQASSTAATSASDKQFIQEAADESLAEVELGKLAVRRATSPQVKDFGRRMAADHSSSNDQIEKLAARKGVSLSQSLGKDNKVVRDRLEKLSGSQFDSAYMAEMLKDHKKDLETYSQQSRTANDDEVKSFAAKTLPTLQNHLKQAEMIAPDLKAQHNPGRKPSPAIAQTHPPTTATKASGKTR
jgi:putative membrane protein